MSRAQAAHGKKKNHGAAHGIFKWKVQHSHVLWWVKIRKCVRGVCFFHASKIVLMVTAQAAHGVREQNIEPRMAFLNEKFNTLTFCAGSKSESLWGVSFFVAWKVVHVVHSQLRNAWAPMVLGVRIPLRKWFPTSPCNLQIPWAGSGTYITHWPIWILFGYLSIRMQVSHLRVCIHL